MRSFEARYISAVEIVEKLKAFLERDGTPFEDTEKSSLLDASRLFLEEEEAVQKEILRRNTEPTDEKELIAWLNERIHLKCSGCWQGMDCDYARGTHEISHYFAGEYFGPCTSDELRFRLGKLLKCDPTVNEFEDFIEDHK